MSDELTLVKYLVWRAETEKLDNAQLARALLRAAPLFTNLSDLCEIAAERLSPGVIEAMAEAAEHGYRKPAAQGDDATLAAMMRADDARGMRGVLDAIRRGEVPGINAGHPDIVRLRDERDRALAELAAADDRASELGKREIEMVAELAALRAELAQWKERAESDRRVSDTLMEAAKQAARERDAARAEAGLTAPALLGADVRPESRP